MKSEVRVGVGLTEMVKATGAPLHPLASGVMIKLLLMGK